MKKAYSCTLSLIIFALFLSCGGGGGSKGSESRFNGGNNEIIAYSFSSSKNSSLGIKTDITGRIRDNSISLEVPYSASPNGLVPEFVSNSKDIKVKGKGQESGKTANDFSSPVTYSVYADDGTKRDYTVTVIKALNSGKKITSYSINGITGTIDDNSGTISLILPPRTDTTALAASFSFIGKSITVNGIAQSSGATTNDFSGAVEYTVTADDASKRTYTVSVDVEKAPWNDITGFAFRKSENPSLAIDAAGIINGTGIQVELPFGSVKTDLIAYFVTDGESVKIDEAEQKSGITHNNFTENKIYRVTAENGSTKDYTIIVSVAKSGSKEITAFSLDGESGTINEQSSTIDIQFEASKNLANLIATFATTGVSVKVNGASQTSGVSVNDFSGPLTYSITADNGTSRNYTVNAVKSGEITGLWNFEYGSDGSYTVSGTTEVPGITGNALQFNGLTDYVVTPDSDSLTLANGGSIEVVVNAITHRPYAGIVHKGVLNDFSDETYSLQFWGAGGTDGTIRFLVHNTSQDADHYSCIDSSTKLNTGTWYHIIAAWDPAHLALYINGNRDAYIETDVGEVKDSPGGLVIGAQMDHQFSYTPWGDLGFNGIIDRVEILNHSIPDSEAYARYQEFVNSAGTGFTAYIISVAKHNIPYVLIIFAVIVMALAVLYVYNRRHSKTAS